MAINPKIDIFNIPMALTHEQYEAIHGPKSKPDMTTDRIKSLEEEKAGINKEKFELSLRKASLKITEIGFDKRLKAIEWEIAALRGLTVPNPLLIIEDELSKDANKQH